MPAVRSPAVCAIPPVMSGISMSDSSIILTSYESGFEFVQFELKKIGIGCHASAEIPTCT